MYSVPFKRKICGPSSYVWHLDKGQATAGHLLSEFLVQFRRHTLNLNGMYLIKTSTVNSNVCLSLQSMTAIHGKSMGHSSLAQTHLLPNHLLIEERTQKGNDLV